ncbi:MAG: hypothetical protein NZ941_04445 [Candidatus Caldarchaeum sp.]|nr:hypothetical protein [Candidatus Caldarchaeum sp.]MDW7978517.1 hypothetical protein [Candidatus Caldarchaeum sp.]
MIRGGKWSEEQKYEVVKSSIGNALINLKLLVDFPLIKQMELMTDDERQTLLTAIEVVKNIMKRAKDKGIMK